MIIDEFLLLIGEVLEPNPHKIKSRDAISIYGRCTVMTPEEPWGRSWFSCM